MMNKFFSFSKIYENYFNSKEAVLHHILWAAQTTTEKNILHVVSIDAIMNNSLH